MRPLASCRQRCRTVREARAEAKAGPLDATSRRAQPRDSPMAGLEQTAITAPRTTLLVSAQCGLLRSVGRDARGAINAGPGVQPKHVLPWGCVGRLSTWSRWSRWTGFG
jgi:hypothetical protein